MKYLSTTALAAAILVAPAAAQDTSADPTYETVRLSGGFAPDPYTVSVRSGGTNDASRLGNGCRGFVATRPDVRLHFDAGSLPLILSTTSDADTTLVVNAPNGEWYCDDDSAGSLNARLRFSPAMSGRYEIWIGTYGGGGEDYHDARLHISELSNGSDDHTPNTPRPEPRPDTGRSIDLSAGFAPDPYTIRLMSGGSRDASTVSSGCRGYIATSPDATLDYSAGSMPLYLSVDSMADTTLVVQGPNGAYYCNDDGGEGMNPSVQFNTPLSGRYRIWVGTYGSRENHSAELNISELYSE